MVCTCVIGSSLVEFERKGLPEAISFTSYFHHHNKIPKGISYRIMCSAIKEVIMLFVSYKLIYTMYLIPINGNSSRDVCTVKEVRGKSTNRHSDVKMKMLHIMLLCTNLKFKYIYFKI